MNTTQTAITGERTPARVKHQHSFSRSKPTASVETCSCGKFRFTEHAGESIVGIPAHRPFEIEQEQTGKTRKCYETHKNCVDVCKIEKFKQVSFSYPTSINSDKFGFHKTGCYVVQLVKGIMPPKAIAGFETREQAIAFAAALPNRWSNLFLKMSIPRFQP